MQHLINMPRACPHCDERRPHKHSRSQVVKMYTEDEVRALIAEERRAAAEGMRNYIASQICATVENAEGDYKAGAMAAERVCRHSVYTAK